MDNVITDFSYGLLIWQIIGFILIGLWIYCLIDIYKNQFEKNNKTLWFLVVLLLPFFGSLLYLFLRKKKKVRLN